MRIARRLLAAAMCALAALAMCVGLVGTAWGEEAITSGNFGETKGEIAVGNAVSGQTYSIYKMFDMSFDKATGAYSYKVAEGWAGFFDTGAGASYIAVNDEGYVTGTVGENFTNNSARAEAFAKAALAWTKESTPNIKASRSMTCDTGENTVVFEGLAYGYYLVDSSLGAVCSLDSTNPSAKIEDKNDKAPSVEKWIVETSDNGEVLTWKNDAAIGDTVTFRAVVTGQNLGAQVFTFHDETGTGFSLVGGYTVTLNKGVKDKEVTLDGKTDYTVTTAKDLHSFKLEFKGAQPFANALETITIEYTATVTADAVIRDGGNVNTAFVTYGDDPENPETSAVSTTTTMVWSFDVKKYTVRDGNEVTLAGATFELRKGSAEGKAINFTAGANNDYKYAPTAGEGTSTQITTDGTGKFTISGLDSGTYYLTEFKAPNGYNKLQKPLKVVISSTTNTEKRSDEINGGGVTVDVNGNTESTGKGEVDGNDVNLVKVLNNTGTELPSTGGMGTTVIYVAGGLLVAAAVVLLVAKKKMSADDK